MTAQNGADASKENGSSDDIVVENEFARVRARLIKVGNGERLLIEDTKTGQCFTLDPLELEGLAWADPDDLERFVDPSRARRWEEQSAS
jgi:hypothetical protein